MDARVDLHTAAGAILRTMPANLHMVAAETCTTERVGEVHMKPTAGAPTTTG